MIAGGRFFSHNFPVSFRIVLVLLLSLGAIGCAGLRPVFRQSGPVADAQTRDWQKKIVQAGQDGDWLVIRGYNSADHLVAVAGNAELSHVGILDATHGEVVEAVSPVVRAVPLRNFLNGADRVLLIRPRDANVQSGRTALSNARSQIGAPYDLMGPLGFPEKGKFYCSELAAWSAGMEVDRDGPAEVLHPADMPKRGAVLFDSVWRRRP